LHGLAGPGPVKPSRLSHKVSTLVLRSVTHRYEALRTKRYEAWAPKRYGCPSDCKKRQNKLYEGLMLLSHGNHRLCHFLFSRSCIIGRAPVLFVARCRRFLCFVSQTNSCIFL
jgi:hypothetical protein